MRYKYAGGEKGSILIVREQWIKKSQETLRCKSTVMAWPNMSYRKLKWIQQKKGFKEATIKDER